jgi:hypothetical protein
MSFLISGAGYADDGKVKINLASHSSHHVYKQGDKVEIKGTAQNLTEVSITVQDEQGKQVFNDRPKVENGVFTSCFTLDPAVTEGKYTIIAGSVDQPEMKRYKFSVASVDNSGSQAEAGEILTIKGNGVEKEISFTRAELEAMSQEREIFSVVSDWPGNLFVAAQGVPLRILLEKAEMKPGVQMITFRGSDGYRIDFTADELLNETRYYFPNLLESSTDGKKEAQPIIALQRVEDDDDYAKMSDRDTPVLCFGQRALTEQILCEYVKRLKTITVTTDTPDQWEQPSVKIIDPDTRQEIAAPGGKIKKGSEVVLESDPKVKVYYTIDGAAPDLESKIYNVSFHVPTLNKPIIIESDTVIKAKTVGWGKRDSEAATFTFIVDGSCAVQSSDGQAVDGKAPAFNDIRGNWAKDDINYLAQKGIIGGINAAEFKPEGEITRAQFAKLLVNALNIEVKKDAVLSFSDAPAWAWYHDYAAAAVNAGLIKGYNENIFAPDSSITREQMAVILSRALKMKSPAEEAGASTGQAIDKFADKGDISPWARQEIAPAISSGIVSGVSADTLSPKTFVTRAQAAVMVSRLYNKLN